MIPSVLFTTVMIIAASDVVITEILELWFLFYLYILTLDMNEIPSIGCGLHFPNA